MIEIARSEGLDGSRERPGSGFHWKARETSPGGLPMRSFGQPAPDHHQTNTKPPMSPAGVSPAVTGRDVAHAA
jgi:hypothetical protein